MKQLFSIGFEPHWAIRVCLIFAVILTFLIILKSDYNRSPDEIHHFLAAEYYTNHFLPPLIDDPAIRESYSGYGVSYLNYHWIEYFYAGKFAFLISPIVRDPLTAVRLSSVFLLAFLAALFLHRAAANAEHFIIPTFVIVTPQVWYVFSYANNDAFAFSISILIAYQLSYPQSLLNRFLQNKTFSANLAGGALFGLLTGLLLVCKANYWAFLIFVVLWLAFNFPFDLQTSKKYLFVAMIAVLVLGFRAWSDFYVNGETNFVGVSYLNYISGDFEKKQGKLLAYQEEVADKCCKQSTLENDLMNSHQDMKLKAKGFSISHLFTKLKWHEFSFASFVGGYGYMDLWASRDYYQAMALLYTCFGLYLIAAIVSSKDKQSIKQLSITAFAVALTIFTSVYLSWSYAFQPQGRYLFPIIPMLGVLIYFNRQHLHNFIVHAFVICTFLLSVYSFVFVAIAKINSVR